MTLRRCTNCQRVTGDRNPFGVCRECMATPGWDDARDDLRSVSHYELERENEAAVDEMFEMREPE